jgi:putative transposase
VALIDAHRDSWGVEPICQVLEIAPSTYYAATSWPTSARQLRDEELKVARSRACMRRTSASTASKRSGGS